jgi:hypothetical protein
MGGQRGGRQRSAAQQIELECSNAQHIDQSAGTTIEQAPKSHRISL